MKPLEKLISVAIVWALVALPADAQTLDPKHLSEKQETQNRVRDMARQLIVGVVDVQIRQLEENGLESLDLYGDVCMMRENIDLLIDAAMPEVVELLDRVQAAADDQREQSFVAAREKSREILVKLLVERQNLLRRLRVAEMAAQVKRLIQLESAALQTTESLPELVQSEQESLTLSTVEDQRDVKALYLGLKAMLQDAGTWGGPVGVEAATGLGLLKTGNVDEEIDNVRIHLEEVRFSEATSSLTAVIKGLQALLESIERVQGLVSGDQNAAKEMIQQLARRQEEVRDLTSQPNLSRAETDELAKQQAEIQSELSELNEQLQSPAAEEALQRAEEAAFEATAELFEGRPEDALSQQDNVLENLAEAAERTETQQEQPNESLSAEQYSQLIEDLEAARDDVQEIRRQQETASELADGNPAEAGKQEEQVADALAEVPEDRQLPPDVNTRLAEAEEAANQAAQRMDQPEEERRQATKGAEQAIERAASEIETALADAKRSELAAQIAELAQAARALDQAAAAERDIAKQAEQAANQQGLEADEAAELGRQQADVEDIAEYVAEGVQQSAPEAARILEEAADPLQQAGQQLEAAAQQPGQPSKPAAAEASRQADQAAEKLSEAAAEIRQEIARTAEELAAVTGQQLQQATDALEAVESSIENRPESMAQRLNRLAKAAEKVQQAALEQHRAAGRPEAARAMELADEIRDALRLQDEADRAAQTLTSQDNATPLEAIARQQAVADAAGQLAERTAPPPTDQAEGEPVDEGEPMVDLPEGDDPSSDAPQSADESDPLTEALQQAEEAAADAATNILDGNLSEAQEARAEAREALQEALEVATAQVDQASEAPAGEPDLAAQERVGEAVDEARELAQLDAPEAAQTLEEAGQSSDEAIQQAAEDNPQDTADAQQATADQLDEAATELAEAIDQLSQQAGQQFADQSQESGQLTDQAVPVDPGATAALQSSENQADAAAGEVPQAPQQAGPAEQSIQEAMDQALADLAARQQQLARDQALAEELAGLSQQQQDAADQLAEADQQSDEGVDPSQALAEAWAQLTATQQATLEAAGQVTQGSQAANQSVQQAMALAANMPQANRQNSPVPAASGAVQPGQFVENQPPQHGAIQPDTEPPEGVSRTPDSPDQSAENRQRQFIEEPWMLQLPSEVRAAIRANSQRRAPRGYEERLQRYFKNID